ncbi:intracellular coagulation inhibitor 1-like [Centruroides vittatus]|uniref:intracellular coagulation inhibitor 1-like n=1 Tax=Centruroides vittatus TaxID=120091 RepID=UPI00350F7EBE
MALKYYYNTTVKEVDFQNDAHGAREIINNWVHEQTSGQILHFLPKLLPQTTQIMTVNALYFNSEWLWKFDPAMTEPKARFYVTPHFHASVPMMVAKLHLAHGHSPGMEASILELPFKSNRISLFLVLPDQLEGLLNLQKKLNSTTMKQLISTMKKKDVNVRVPKFTVESQPSIANVLRNLGVNSLFSPSSADLTGITPHHQLHMTDMMHRVVIQLEERGSIATAATAMIVERIGSFNGQFFEADHPFLFFIMDKQSGLVLFMGRIAGP